MISRRRERVREQHFFDRLFFCSQCLLWQSSQRSARLPSVAAHRRSICFMAADVTGLISEQTKTAFENGKTQV